MNKPISYSLAKLLKEKEFDEPCIYRYRKNELQSYTVIKEHKYNSQPISLSDISAPTVADVIMWLYKKHQIWISVNVNINGFFANAIKEWNKKEDAWEVRSIGYVKKHITPTECYEKAIEYTLTKII